MYLKSGMSNPLTSMGKQLKHFDQTKHFTCISIRHLAWILFDSSLIRESDLAMSSSGKMAADKYKPSSTPKIKQQSQDTNSQQIHKHVHVPLVSHVCIAHLLTLPRVDPSRIQLNQIPRPLSRSALPLSFSAKHRYLK